jgi:hypothetical protein
MRVQHSALPPWNGRVIPAPLAPKFLCNWRFAGHDHPNVDVTGGKTSAIAGGLCIDAGLTGGSGRGTRCCRPTVSWLRASSAARGVSLVTARRHKIHSVEHLTKRQRNVIFDAIRETGLDLAECELAYEVLTSPISGQTTRRRAVVKHKPSASSVNFRDGSRRGKYIVAARVTDGPNSESGPVDWDQVIEHIQGWAGEVKYVTSTPDFWEEVKAGRAAIAAVDASDADNTPFSEAEQEQISAAFAASIEAARQRYALADEQVAVIAEGVRELVEASRTMGRKDWLAMVGSAGFGWIASSLVPGDVAVHIVGLALRGVAHLFGVDLPPLELG